MIRATRFTLAIAAVLVVSSGITAAPYYGTKIGSLNKLAHDVEGEVYAVDDKTIFLKGFSYDGQGPDAFFWGGTTQKPDSTGFIIPDEKGKKTPLGEYRSRNILLRLPAGRTLRNIKWFSVWCRKFNANFGDILIPSDLLIPSPSEIGRIPTKEHGVSSGPVMIVDTQTLLVPEFTYDGLGPAAYWWVSRGAKQHPRGTRLADENGSFTPLPRYTGKTVVITLPDDKTIYDYDWFGVWCEEARVDFGSVQLPQSIIVPPSPRMLGVELEYKLNCEVLYDELGFEIRWIMDGEDIVMQMVAKLENNEYMSFGLSKNDSRSQMINSDAIVTWIDRSNRGHAVDYFLGSKEQCVGQRGSCPDVRHSDGEDSVNLLNAAVVNGYTMITFKRPQVGLDEKYDQHVYSDGPQAIVWAIGPLNNRDEVSYHGIMRSEGDVFIDFARPPQWNCPQPEDPKAQSTSTTTPRPRTTTTTRRSTRRTAATVTTQRKPKPTSATDRRRNQFAAASRVTASRATESKKPGWKPQQIVCPADRTFRAQIGPTGGKKGYQSITGSVGWGIAWYIDGLLIPEITVQRGKTYTFIVEGGMDPDNQARQHPLYITDDPEGGYEHKTSSEKKKTKVYGGVTRDRTGKYSASAVGRLCEYKLPSGESADDFDTFEEFQQNLELKCERGKPGKMLFKPDHNTPDLLYYQCYTHRFLGWKIHVVDSCEETSGALEIGASFTHVKNITLNSLQGKVAGDYKRGNSREKQKQDYTSYKTGNDGIPIELHESEFPDEEIEYEEEEDVVPSYRSTTSTPTTERQLYYRPGSPSSYATKNQYYYQYNRPSTSAPYKWPKSNYYTTTLAPESYTKKSMYVKYPTTQTAARKKPVYAYHSSYSTYGTTQRPLQKNILHTRVPEAIKLYSLESPTSQELIYHTRGQSVIFSPSKSSGVRVTIFPGADVQTISPTANPIRTTTRSQTPWWKPIGSYKPAASTTNAQKTKQQQLRHQVPIIPDHRIPLPATTKSPITMNYHNGFLPLVIKNNGTFDRALVDFPPDGSLEDSPYYRRGNKKHVHVLIRTGGPRSEVIRRANGNGKIGYIKTPVGNFRLPNSPPRRKSQLKGQSSEEADAAFLPLLLPNGHVNGTAAAATKNTLPIIPIVVPEKKGDNVYILHHVLSLITDSPLRANKPSVERKPSSFRTRVARSADHRPDHVHHDGHDHHDGMDHSNHKKSSKKNSSSLLSPLVSLMVLCSILFVV